MPRIRSYHILYEVVPLKCRFFYINHYGIRECLIYITYSSMQLINKVKKSTNQFKNEQCKEIEGLHEEPLPDVKSSIWRTNSINGPNTIYVLIEL